MLKLILDVQLVKCMASRSNDTGSNQNEVRFVLFFCFLCSSFFSVYYFLRYSDTAIKLSKMAKSF